MGTKNVLLFTLMLGVLSIAAIAYSADVDCRDLVNNTCTGCHEKELLCKEIGKPLNFWIGKLSLMVANGADINKKERAALAECLSKPENDCLSACRE